ncbi:EthD family reductase [Pseudomonas congelans]|uniref:EthD family reductase n=1 Tax=Pseudomonas congelans TaxID=200452 RepID=UPI0016561484|nr:EthD family reductase [Pseudomonas congelans]MBC8802638.1 EthD family reductase [Pseudomonas congelans]
MIYRSAVFSRKEGLSSEEFRTHWINVHGTLAKHMPHLHAYNQNHIAECLYETDEPLDHAIAGISQLAFDDIGAMERSEVSPEYVAVKHDIPNFQGAITILVLSPHVVVEPPAKFENTRTKLFWLSIANGDISSTSIQQEWPLTSRQEYAKVSEFEGFIQNFVVDRAHPVSAGVPQGVLPVEAISEAWFEDVDALKAWVSSDVGQRLIHQDPMLKTIGVYVIEELTII